MEALVTKTRKFDHFLFYKSRSFFYRILCLHMFTRFVISMFMGLFIYVALVFINLPLFPFIS